MSGELNLDLLIGGMNPVLRPGEFVFCTAPTVTGNPICAFREPEGWTLVLERHDAERLGIDYGYPSRMITLNIHSSLDAVGLLAVVAEELAAAGISLNVVSGYYHDHLFVPVERAEEAVEILIRRARRSRQ